MGPDQEVIFEEEQITLDIPEVGVVLGGWRIIPHSYPRVSELDYLAVKKNLVAQFCGQYICNVYVCMLSVAHMTGRLNRRHCLYCCYILFR